MKNVNFQDFARHPLMQRYRVFRQGILVLPHLESHLHKELQKLSEIHVPASKVPVEREYVINSLRTIRKQIRTTYQSLAIAKRIIEKNVSEADLQKATADVLKGSPNAKDLLVRLKTAGGASKLMDSILVFLRPRYDQYSKSIAMAEKYYGPDHNKTLAEMVLTVERGLPGVVSGGGDLTIIALCWNALSCLISGVTILVTLAVTEGEAEGDEDEDEGSGPGDFPEPDPDGEHPA